MHKVLLNRAVRADRATSGDVKWRALYGKALWDEQLGLGACDRPCHPVAEQVRALRQSEMVALSLAETDAVVTS